MKTVSTSWGFLLLLGLAQLPGGPAFHRDAPGPTGIEPASGAVVCPPGVYAIQPDECLPLGPSQDLADLAAQGIPFPLLPMPAYAPDPGLAEIPYRYFKLTQEDALFYLFTTLEDAMESSVSGVSVGPGFVYVSYVDVIENEAGIFYHLRTGGWVRGDFGARAALHRPFQGLQFSSTPATSFGWVLGEVPSYTDPGYSAPRTGRTHYRYEVVQVFAVEEAEDSTWLMIGPDEWLDYRQVARVEPDPAPPEGVTTGRWISVDLDEQTLEVYEDSHLVFATVIASGTGAWATRPGLFQIYRKVDPETMSGATEADRSDYYYLQDVPWTMYFDEGRALHGAYWHDGFGYPRSHGCINLSLGDSHWLYDWAQVDDYIHIFDLSSKP